MQKISNSDSNENSTAAKELSSVSKTPPPVISIVSKKKAGKTTFIVKLIQEMKTRGYKVGTLKHDIHNFDIDHEGKDTYKHKQAGSDTVVISSPWRVAVIKDVDEEQTVDQLVASYFMDMDIVITEGYKNANKPQIEIFRDCAHKCLIYQKGETSPIIAIASNVELDMDVPVYNINDIRGIAELIENRFLKN